MCKQNQNIAQDTTLSSMPKKYTITNYFLKTYAKNVLHNAITIQMIFKSDFNHVTKEQNVSFFFTLLYQIKIKDFIS